MLCFCLMCIVFFFPLFIVACPRRMAVLLYHQHSARNGVREPLQLVFFIRSMRVSKLPSIRPSRCGRGKRKCWSQIALAGMGEERFSGPSL